MEKVAVGAPDCIVVIDEAYVDFSSQGSAIQLLSQYPNMVVLQTLSKAFGMAAIRCGFCAGAPDVIQLMNNVKAPYNVNELTSRKALEAMDSLDALKTNIQSVLEQREIVAAKLNELEYVVKVYPSDANFLLVQFKDHSTELYKGMANNCKVITRYRGSELHCTECLRITVGTSDENRAFLEALDKTYKSLTA